jgi:hypothetical protein
MEHAVTRFFRASVAVYESICQQLDAAYEYPNAETKTQRTLPQASCLAVDGHGRVCIALPAEFCGYDLPSQMLPQLLASGAVEEITEAEYMAALPQPSTP